MRQQEYVIRNNETCEDTRYTVRRPYHGCLYTVNVGRIHREIDKSFIIPTPLTEELTIDWHKFGKATFCGFPVSPPLDEIIGCDMR